MAKFVLLSMTAFAVLGLVQIGAAQTFRSIYANHDITLNTDSASAFWRGAGRVYLERDVMGGPAPGLRTEVLSRWTKNNLYLLYICPYQELNLKPNPNPHKETNGLWNWDVAEAFIGWNFNDISRYKEFEVSPQGEWVDLAIDLREADNSHNWKWNSGFSVTARINYAKKVWYGAMQIPFASIDPRPPKAGTLLRVNLFRSQGPDHHDVVWQPTMEKTFHVPSRFGILELVDPH